MRLSIAQRRYLLIGHVLVPIICNVLICGLIGIIDYRHLTVLPKWGFPQSMSVDLAASSFLLPWITCLIATPLTHRDVHRGTVSSLTHDQHLPVWLRPFARAWYIRAPLFGLTGLLLVGSTACVVLSLLPWSSAAVSRFLLVKVSLAAVYGSLVTPAIAILAMYDRSHNTPPT